MNKRWQEFAELGIIETLKKDAENEVAYQTKNLRASVTREGDGIRVTDLITGESELIDLPALSAPIQPSLYFAHPGNCLVITIGDKSVRIPASE